MTLIQKGKWFALILLAGIAASQVHVAQADEQSVYSGGRPNASAGGGSLGLGILLGEPIGLTAERWLGDVYSVDGMASYSWSKFIEVAADFKVHFPNAVPWGGKNEFVPYVGVGLIGFSSTTTDFTGSNSNLATSLYRNDTTSTLALGARVPVGLEWLPKQSAIGVFAEVDPGYGFIPTGFGFFQADLGIRLYI